MRRTVAVVACLICLTPSAFAQVRSPSPFYPDGSTADPNAGLIIIGNGNQTFWSLGGVLMPRAVKIVTRTPEGKQVTRFRMPSVFQDPNTPPYWELPGMVNVQVPDAHALLFVDGEKVSATGTSRQLESPRLPPGKSFPLRVRAAYVAGDRFVIEEREIVIRGGATTVVGFDGSRVVASVPLEKNRTHAGITPAGK